MNRTKGEMVKELSQTVLKRVDRKDKKNQPQKAAINIQSL